MRLLAIMVATIFLLSCSTPYPNISHFASSNYIQQSPHIGDSFTKFTNNPVNLTTEKPVSTFSIDVDTASYSYVRRTLNEGNLPDKNSVRTEELINYFPYNYKYARSPNKPFKANVAIYPTPWNRNTKLLHIGLKGLTISSLLKPKTNLVFLIDTSGSMHSQDKLGLLKKSLTLLVHQLDENDTVAIVAYAGNAGTILKPTRISEKQKILNALDNLHAGGSTAGVSGIKHAYALAEENFTNKGINRIILATDGDFNVGISNPDKLKEYIQEKRKSGIYLSVLGFGLGNYRDTTMQALAQNGNGTAAYIDTLREAKKVLVDEASATLFTIAKDVKIQVEFNPSQIAEYRLIGYETRTLKREDFKNDKVDAGDIGSGHTVTAIYEITPIDSPARQIAKLRYASHKVTQVKKSHEYAFLKLRYKLPHEKKSRLINIPITRKHELNSINKAPSDLRFAASVAAFGQKLRKSKYLGNFDFDDIANLASHSRGKDHYGYRAEFVSLVRLTSSLEKTGR